MRIEIILDRTQKVVQGNFPVFLEESDYVDAYRFARKAIKEKRETKILVYKDPLKTWLVNALKKYKTVEIVKSLSKNCWPKNGKSRMM